MPAIPERARRWPAAKVVRLHGGEIAQSADYAMDNLTLFGLLAVTAMLIFYALEDRSPWYVLAFAAACAFASAYGFLQGAWPFGLVEAVWSAVALRRWQLRLAGKRGIEQQEKA